jgi:hypothetical protein
MKKKPSNKSVQGEGDYIAAERYRKSVRDFVESGEVEDAAQAAPPDSTEEAEDLKRAEEEGASRSKGEGSLVTSKDKSNE